MLSTSPDQNSGPLPGSALGDAGDLFDYVSIQFYNNPSCAGANTADGYSQWDTWCACPCCHLLMRRTSTGQAATLS